MSSRFGDEALGLEDTADGEVTLSIRKRYEPPIP
jgi:hypothetical protein